MIDSIPLSLKLAIAAGIGMFLAIIGLKSAGIIQERGNSWSHWGLKSLPVVLAVIGFLVMVALDARGIPSAIIIGILTVTAAGIALGVNSFGGVVSMPPSIAPVFLNLIS